MSDTIILDDFGLFLGKTGERFVVKKKGEKLDEFPVRNVERIVVSSSGASLSSAAIYLAVENRVPLSFTYRSGRPFAFLTPTKGHGTVLTRRAQYTNVETKIGTLLAKGFVRGKMRNQYYLLKTWAKNRTRTDPETSENLFGLSEHVDSIMTELSSVDGNLNDGIREQIMNIEGRVASEYWNGVGAILPPEFQFVGRETRGAEDPFNMMLNYGYGILYSEVWSAVTIAGLDPFAGFLHVDRPGRPSLVLDLIEEFRQQVVDRSVMRLVIRQTLQIGDIAKEGELAKVARKEIASAVVGRLEDRVTHSEKKVPVQSIILKQAWAIARVLKGEDNSYHPFYLRW